MTDAFDTLNLARAERERRRRARLAAFPSYGEWLPMASPEWDWSYRWLQLVQFHYDLVTAGIIKRLLIMAPPQHGKSESGTVRYPAYRLEREPVLRVLTICHTQRLANKFSRKTRAVAERRMKLSKDRNSVEEWETAAGGSLRAVGVGGSTAGSPAELIFIDDPIRSRADANSIVTREKLWDFYVDDVISRLQKNGAIIMQLTRWHEDDLAGRVLASAEGPDWTVLKFPALAEKDDILGRLPGEALCPERHTRESLEKRRDIDPWKFDSLYQQNPTPRDGGMFKRLWFDNNKVATSPLDVVGRYRVWDMASTADGGDWTAGFRVSKGKDGLWYLEHVERGQWETHKRDKKVLEVAGTDPAGTKFHREQEPGSSGVDSCKAFVRLLAGYTATYAPSSGPKEARAEALASQMGAGNVRVVQGHWVPGMVSEFCQFPFGSNDDQVDSGSSGFNLLAAKRQSKSY